MDAEQRLGDVARRALSVAEVDGLRGFEGEVAAWLFRRLRPSDPQSTIRAFASAAVRGGRRSTG